MDTETMERVEAQRERYTDAQYAWMAWVCQYEPQEEGAWPDDFDARTIYLLHVLTDAFLESIVARRPISRKALAAATGFAPQTVERHLALLVEAGFIHRDGEIFEVLLAGKAR
jgi:hypothetical protein